MRQARAFSLLELMVTLIIIGIVVSLAVPTYLRSIERTRAGKAMEILSQIRTIQQLYSIEANHYAPNLNVLETYGEVPYSPTYRDTMWNYSTEVGVTGNTTFNAIATRRPPSYFVNCKIVLDSEGVIAFYDSSGTLVTTYPPP